MRLRIVAMLGAVALMSGCQPSDEAAGWNADFNAQIRRSRELPFAAQYGTSPRFYTSQRRADVPVANPSSRGNRSPSSRSAK